MSASAGGGGCQCVSPPQRHRASRVEIGMSSSSFGRQCIHVLESVHMALQASKLCVSRVVQAG